MNIKGKVFGFLTVIKRKGFVVYESGKRVPVWECVCECGNMKKIRQPALTAGRTISCGCYSKIASITHGMSGTSIYKRWGEIRQRCLNINSKAYIHYGGRGIKVCNEWNNFETFYADMGDPPTPEHSIDRIDNDGDYSPDNCRWATNAEQNRNQSTTRLISFRGKTLCLSEWARIVGVARSTLRDRLKNWSLKQALTTPKGVRRK